MAKLFDTKLELSKLFVIPESDEVVNTETGEVLDMDYLNSLQSDFNETTKYLLQECLNLEADIKAYKEQKDVFAKKQKTAENKRDSLKSYLSACLDGNPFEADDKSVKATFRRSESVNIINLDLLRDEYKTTKIEISADKTAIKKAFKDGLEVFGAELVTSNNIQIK